MDAGQRSHDAVGLAELGRLIISRNFDRGKSGDVKVCIVAPKSVGHA